MQVGADLRRGAKRVGHARDVTCSGCEVVKRSRRRPGTAATRSRRPAKSTSAVAVGVHGLAEQHDLGVAARDEALHLGARSPRARGSLRARACAAPRRSCRRGCSPPSRSRRPVPGSSGRPPRRARAKLSALRSRSTAGRPGRGLAQELGHAVDVVRPDEHVHEGRPLQDRPPSSWATHPPTPMRRPGFFSFCRRRRWSEWSSLLAAFSRTAQVLMKTKSARGRVGCGLHALRGEKSRHRSESLTFIWQPNVLTKYRLFVFADQKIGLRSEGSGSPFRGRGRGRSRSASRRRASARSPRLAPRVREARPRSVVRPRSTRLRTA